VEAPLVKGTNMNSKKKNGKVTKLKFLPEGCHSNKKLASLKRLGNKVKLFDNTCDSHGLNILKEESGKAVQLKLNCLCCPDKSLEIYYTKGKEDGGNHPLVEIGGVLASVPYWKEIFKDILK